MGVVLLFSVMWLARIGITDIIIVIISSIIIVVTTIIIVIVISFVAIIIKSIPPWSIDFSSTTTH